MTNRQQAYNLADLFYMCYKEKYGRKPDLNRFQARWGFEDMIADLGYARAVQVIQYYFKTGRSRHDTQGLFYSYTDLDKMITESDDDQARRARLREETKRRVEELEAREPRSTDDSSNLPE